MPIEHTVWKVAERPARLAECMLESEKELEDLICADMAILNEGWLLIGRQVATGYGKYIDLLALDQTGSVIIVELKKNKTPRDVIAQAMDYATWIRNLNASEISKIYQDSCQRYAGGSISLDQAFKEKFATTLDEDNLNSSHQMVVVATELDSSTERIVTYVNDFGIPLNVMFFRVFRDGEAKYLSRAWFIDPAETQEHATAPKETEPWNGEYYVSFGLGERNWEDARKYGFISAGGGRWYTQTLNSLSKGDRVWVNIPQWGYVGVGIVEEPVVKIDEFTVQTDDGMKPILEAPINADYHRSFQDDDDRAEYFVRVKWLVDVPKEEAKSEVGFFGNQNTVARPTSPKWPHTIARLKALFGIS